MKATIQADNQATNIAIKIETMNANINGTLQSVKKSVLNAFRALSMPRIYRNQLRMINYIAQFIENHPATTDAVLWLMGVGIIIEAFLFA